MDYNQIISLIDKGFTPDQIMILTGSGITQEEQPTTEPETLPEVVPEVVQEEPPAETEPEENSTLSELMSMVKSLSEEVSNLRKDQQKKNIVKITGDKLMNPEGDANDILAGIIRPPLNDKSTKK